MSFFELPENLDDSLFTGGLGGDADSILTSGLDPSGQSTSASPAILIQPSGEATPLDDLPVNLGGQSLNFDQGRGQFTPGLNPSASLPGRSRSFGNEDEVVQSYTGADMRVLLELRDPAGVGLPVRKQLVELTTITVSVHRVKTPVPACGFINPRGIARGRRTIAGTLILTQFTVDVMFRFLYGQYRDLAKDSRYVKPDQLPAFDLTLMFANEYGSVSYRQLLLVWSW